MLSNKSQKDISKTMSFGFFGKIIIILISVILMFLIIVNSVINYKQTHNKIIINNPTISENIKEQISLMLNGDKYVGSLKNGKPDGKGTLFYNDGGYIAFEGVFKDGELFEGEYSRYSYLFKMVGVITSGKIDLEITFNDGNSNRPNTKFTFNGYLNGYGELTENLDDVTYKGEFKDGMMHGKGLYRNAKHSSTTGNYTDYYTEGYWERGKLIEIYKEWNEKR